MVRLAPRLLAICLAVICTAVLRAEGVQGQSSGPLSPAQALDQFVIHPDCRIELVAAEPDVMDPVALAFSADRRLWVVEYSDYPNGPDPKEPGRSRIRVLTDEDGDGRFENSRIFADKLLFANGLLPWKEGLIVTTDGKVMFLRDTDGDGRADEKQIWFQGFALDNPQLRCSFPTLGPDNKIYIANGLRGGKIVPGPTNPWGLSPDATPVSISGMDFRFDPFTGACEAISGVGQFGLSFDDWGNRFVCDNRRPCKHVVLEDNDLKQVPWLRVDRVFEDVSPAGEHSRLFPISSAYTTSHLHANQFTAACGLLIYRGDALGKEFYGNSFVCDPTGNLVHRDILDPRVTTFSSHVGQEGVEFLASRDEWFRPVSLAHGPDGALYVCDMYRKVIEHPQFMPDHLKNRTDLLEGTDKGRIWKIVPKEGSQRVEKESAKPLSELAPWQLVKLLSHPNAWQRDTAYRLLLEQRGTQGRVQLETLIESEGAQLGKGQALRLLQAMKKCTPSLLQAGLKDSTSERAAMQIASEQGLSLFRLVANGNLRGTERDYLPSADDLEDPQDIAQLLMKTRWRDWPALSADNLHQLSPRRDILTALALFHDEPFFPAILVIHAGDDLADLTTSVYRAQRGQIAGLTERPGSSSVRFFSETLARKNDEAEIRNYLAAVLSGEPSPQFGDECAALTGLLRGWKHSPAKFRELLDDLPADARDRLTEALGELRTALATTEEGAPARLSDLQLLQLDEAAQAVPLLQALAEKGDPGATRQAMEILSVFTDPVADAALGKLLEARSPQVRRQAVAALASTPTRAALLLDELEAKRVSPFEVDAAAQKQLNSLKDVKLRDRAKALLKVEPPADRAQVLKEYAECFKLATDPARGKLVFEKNCAMCHRVGNIGVNVGPDISDFRNKTDDFILTNILDPNRAIDNNYFSFTVFDTDGRVHTGVLAAETSTSLTLKQPEGKTITLPRDEIEEIKNNGISLMPANLERVISQQEMADLVSYIRDWRSVTSAN